MHKLVPAHLGLASKMQKPPAFQPEAFTPTQINLLTQAG
jgi:hypothetical protein